MKDFDIKVDINQVTYMDEFTLMVYEDKHKKQEISLDTADLLNLYDCVKQAVDENIIY